ncbi:MAG TPA: methyltransferase domain-containing protein [Jatrophihabitans sp.]|uniref:class I SAM-dependent methyltransferase n=1 Tax=Jatrophihabitans sp. TaxID=1932789 RepID=UPI002E04E23B|nr:methyltransferase domain-containing protein [Jatrophihabitans sp.]
MTDHETAAEPAEAWAGDRVTRWLRLAPGLERQLAPVTPLLFEAAAVQPGEAVLDVGCGTGPTTRAAAALAGPGGRVTGLDISPEMLAAAGALPAEGAPIDWVEADAVTWTPPPAGWDLVLSSFGVMFFSDPPAAVRNLATATRPGGRLAVAVWGPRNESELFDLPYDLALAARRAHEGAGEEQPVDAGPGSWSDRDVVTALLTGAGWRDVTVTPHRLRLAFGGGLDPRAAADTSLELGPARIAMKGAAEGTIAAFRDELENVYRDRVDENGHVVLGASIRIVTARR